MGKNPGRRESLDNKEQTPKLFDNRGSLEQMPLATLLQSMQAQRATGTLQLRQGGETFALFFLFGHLFHAYGDGTQGEEAVFVPLTWQHGDYTFDPKSKLPAEETIKASTADILAEAERRGLAPSNSGSAPRPAPPVMPPSAAGPSSSSRQAATGPGAPPPQPEATATELYPVSYTHLTLPTKA